MMAQEQRRQEQEPVYEEPRPEGENPYSWGMVVDLDRCIGCQACVVACWAENNIPINNEEDYLRYRAKAWIRIERYWEGEFPHVKARYMPVLCQHCQNAPCEPVCPVFATMHSSDGLNLQIYNRCVGTRYCQNNCPYNVRYFNWGQPDWPEPLNSQLNPDVTVRAQGVIEKCTFCIQRINRAKRDARQIGRELEEDELQPACAQACPTGTLVFGNWNNPNSRLNRLKQDPRHYELLEHYGTEPAVLYLKKVDPTLAVAAATDGARAAATPPVIRREAEGRWLVAEI